MLEVQVVRFPLSSRGSCVRRGYQSLANAAVDRVFRPVLEVTRTRILASRCQLQVAMPALWLAEQRCYLSRYVLERGALSGGAQHDHALPRGVQQGGESTTVDFEVEANFEIGVSTGGQRQCVVNL